jgi:hypothetical protein
LEKGARGDDADALIVTDSKQIVIAGDDVFSASFHGGGKDRIVVRIS